MTTNNVLTYENQPDNVGAWRLGEASRAAKTRGDPINDGLRLLKELQARGYGVIALDANLGRSDALTADARATIMDACQSVSRSADALKDCHTVDGDWGDDLDAKAFYDAELNLLARLTALLDNPGQPEPRAEVTDAARDMLTYNKQPDNVGAWRIGEACRKAADTPGGDYIDQGLVLLKELQANGYGVIAIDAARSGASS